MTESLLSTDVPFLHSIRSDHADACWSVRSNLVNLDSRKTLFMRALTSGFHTTPPQSISCGIRLSSIFEEFMHNHSFALSSLLIARSHFPGFVRPGVSFIQQNMLMSVYVLRSFCGGHSLYISQVSESRTWLIWYLRTEFLGSVYVFTDPIGLIRPEVSVLTSQGLQLRSQSCTSVIRHHLTSPRATLSTLHRLICFQSLCWSTLVCICLTGATLVC